MDTFHRQYIVYGLHRGQHSTPFLTVITLPIFASLLIWTVSNRTPLNFVHKLSSRLIMTCSRRERLSEETESQTRARKERKHVLETRSSAEQKSNAGEGRLSIAASASARAWTRDGNPAHLTLFPLDSWSSRVQQRSARAFPFPDETFMETSELESYTGVEHGAIGSRRPARA